MKSRKARRRKFHADISYENYGIKNKVTPMEVFVKWLKNKKMECVIRWGTTYVNPRTYMIIVKDEKHAREMEENCLCCL